MNTEYQHLSQYFAAAREDNNKIQLSTEEIEQLLQKALPVANVSLPATTGTFWSKPIVSRVIAAACIVAAGFVTLIIFLPTNKTILEPQNNQNESHIAESAQSIAQTQAELSASPNQRADKQPLYRLKSQIAVFRFRYLELHDDELERLGVVISATEPAFQQPTRVGNEHVEPQKRFLSFPIMLNGALRRGKLRWWSIPQKPDSAIRTGTQDLVSLTIAEELPLRDSLLPIAVSQANGMYYSLPVLNSSENKNVNPEQLVPILVRAQESGETILWYALSEALIDALPERFHAELHSLDHGATPAQTTMSAAFKNVLVQPNPVSDEALITFEISGQHNITAEIIDLQGKQLLRTLFTNPRRQGRQELRINCSALNSGVYMLILRTSSGAAHSTRMLVNK